MISQGNLLVHSKCGIGTKPNPESIHSTTEDGVIMKQEAKKELECAFKKSVSSRYERRINGQYMQVAERVIRTLDERCNIEAHTLWPQEDEVDTILSTHENKKESKVDVEIEDNLGELVAEGAVMNDRFQRCLIYLRTVHQYCLFCGFSYDSIDKLNSDCPGLYKDDH